MVVAPAAFISAMLSLSSKRICLKSGEGQLLVRCSSGIHLCNSALVLAEQL